MMRAVRLEAVAPVGILDNTPRGDRSAGFQIFFIVLIGYQLIQSQNCYYMYRGLELIQSYTGNIWKFSFYNLSYPGNTGNLSFYFISILEILEI